MIATLSPSTLQILTAIDKRANKIKITIDVLTEWLKQMKRKKQENSLSIQQLQAVNEVYCLGVSQLQNARILLAN